MAKSRPFQPGDSTPDFSHLEDQDPESDEPQWLPGGDDRSADAADDDDPAPQQAGGDTPPQRDDQSNTDRADSPAGDSHVFLEVNEPLSDEQMAGETTAYTPPHQRPAAAADNTAPGMPPDGAKDESVFDAAADIGDPPLRVSADNATQLTDVGIPVFQDPPGISAAEAENADAASPTAGTDERAAEAPAEPPVTGALADSDADADEDGPEFAAPQFLASEDSVPPQFAGVDPAPPEPAALSPAEQTAAAAGPAAVAAKSARQARSVSGSRPRRSAASPAPSPAAGDRQRLLLILLASYASAMTIAFLWLWMTRSTARPHELESLPDVAPLGPNEFRYAPQNASMPPGHTLPLGAGEQLGYIQVKPLRVTRGPVQFAHYSDPTQSKPPTAPVLKLWLRFTNVSSDQLIAPLDANLLLTRNYQVETDTVLANQLLLPADKSAQKPAYVIDHPTTSEWDLAGQKLGHRLAPGESLETYIPLEPGSEAHLQGDLLWRVHFRKGYHDATGHGVTTMIEVPFSTADVQSEPAPS